jgi:hypothetical protein
MARRVRERALLYLNNGVKAQGRNGVTAKSTGQRGKMKFI